MKMFAVFAVLALAFALVQGEGAEPFIPMYNVTVNGTAPPPKVSGHIVGGTAATLGQFPWQAGLLSRTATSGNNWSLCGGSLIHQQWVLTAAHCVYAKVQILVTLGSLSYYNSATAINAVGWAFHSGYNPSTLANDVGIIKLPALVTLTANIKTIPIATVAMTNGAANLRVSGWGATCTNCAVSSNLLYANVKALSTAQCTPYYVAGLVTPNTICSMALTSANNQSPCFGDSGGPLIQPGATNYLVGVVSFVSSSGCDNGGKVPAGYMKAVNFCTWIKTFVAITC